MKTILAISLKVLSVLLLCVSGYCDVDLTTTTVHHDMKPKTLNSRGVDRYVAKQTSTVSDLPLEENDTRRKGRHHNNDDIWNWDYWCQLQPQTGNCAKRREKFYYNTQLNQCLNFTYTGCHGNKNRFNSIVDCERHCKGAAFMEIKQVDRSVLCSLQPITGTCVSLYQRYYFNVNEQACKKFHYSGCGGNDNRFYTRYGCLKQCAREQLSDN